MKKILYLQSVVLSFLLLLPTSALLQDLSWQQFQGYDVPFVPTPPEVVDEMLRLVDVKAGDVLYDLGCGDGRIVIAAAQRYKVKAVGIDIDPVRISESNDNAAKAGLAGKVRFIQANLFDTDFRDATVVTMYLLTSVNLRLRPKLLTDLKPGTRLVSHSFGMGDWRPDKTTEVTTTFDDHRDIYFWIVPANVTGRWEWDLGVGPGKKHFALEASQEFQAVTASGKDGDGPVSFKDFSLTGDVLKFQLVAETGGKTTTWLYEGKVAGDTIVGTVRPAGDTKVPGIAWRAVRDPKTIKPIAK